MNDKEIDLLFKSLSEIIINQKLIKDKLGITMNSQYDQKLINELEKYDPNKNTKEDNLFGRLFDK